MEDGDHVGEVYIADRVMLYWLLEKQIAEYLDWVSTNLLQWDFVSIVIDLCFHKTGRFHEKPNKL